MSTQLAGANFLLTYSLYIFAGLLLDHRYLPLVCPRPCKVPGTKGEATVLEGVQVPVDAG